MLHCIYNNSFSSREFFSLICPPWLPRSFFLFPPLFLSSPLPIFSTIPVPKASCEVCLSSRLSDFIPLPGNYSLSWEPDNCFLETLVSSSWSGRVPAGPDCPRVTEAAELSVSPRDGPGRCGSPAHRPTNRAVPGRQDLLTTCLASPSRPLQLPKCDSPKVCPLLFVGPQRIPVCFRVQ